MTLRQFWSKNVLLLTTINEVCQKYLSILTLGEAQRKNSHFTISFSTFLHHLLVYVFKATVHFKCTLCVFVILLCICTFSLLHFLLFRAAEVSTSCVSEQREEVWQSQQLHVGAKASHLRSHNVAPVPRMYGSSLDDQANSQQLPQTVSKIRVNLFN